MTASGAASQGRQRAGQQGVRVTGGLSAVGVSASEVCSWGQQHSPWVLEGDRKRATTLSPRSAWEKVESLWGADCPEDKLVQRLIRAGQLSRAPTPHCPMALHFLEVWLPLLPRGLSLHIPSPKPLLIQVLTRGGYGVSLPFTHPSCSRIRFTGLALQCPSLILRPQDDRNESVLSTALTSQM